jgi:hypothetical protein
MNKKSLLRLFSFLFLFNFLFASQNFAQSVTGSATDTAMISGDSVIVDDAINITYGGAITDVSVLIAVNFKSGDVLTVDNAALPAGASASYNSTSGRLIISGTGTAAEWQNALRTVQFTTTSYEGGTRQISFTIGGAIYNSYNGHYYEFVNTPMDWTSAKAAAESRSLFGLGGYLATITSAEENAFLSSKLQADGWIGCADAFDQINASTGTSTYADQIASEGNWYWVCGPEKGTMFSVGNDNPITVTFANWTSGEPNNSGGVEHYGQIYFGNNGTWNDLPNDPSLALMVEYGGLPGDPVVNLEHSRNISIPSPALLGDAFTPGSFNNNNNSSPVDITVHFTNITNFTNVTVNISEGFNNSDSLEYDPSLLPAGVFDIYNPASGVLNFYGTATMADWNLLLRSVTFKTTSPDLSGRKITFNMGDLPASAEGHFYKQGIFTTDYYSVAHYLDYYQPEMAYYNGMKGYSVNITSAAENNFIQKKAANDFWIPLSDEFTLINEMMGTWYYDDQSATEGYFSWLTGPSKGILVSIGDSDLMTPEAGQYNNWQAGEPNNNGLYGNASYFSLADGKWYDETFYDDDYNYLQKYMLIEYGGSIGDPVMNTIFTKTMSFLPTLPVTLVNFDVKKENKTVVAEWTTSIERNNSYFSVERSGDNQNFLPIGRVNANGSSNSLRQYRFTDQQPLAGISYYRLKQVDIDNHFIYSGTRKIDFKPEAQASQVYPTITKNDITVQLGVAGKVQCFIINEAGSVVQRISPSASVFTVHVQSLAKGIYIFKILNSSGKEENLRFIKQ